MGGPVSVVLVVVALLLATVAAVAARAADVPPIDLRAWNEYDVHADGSYVQTYRLEIHANTTAAARREAQQAVSYSPGLEQLEITEAATRKPDGTLRRAGPAIDELAPGSADLGLLTDRREKVVALPDTEAGDTLILAWRRTLRRPALPGFTAGIYLSRGLSWDGMTVTVHAPRGMKLLTEAHGFDHTESSSGDVVTDRWTAGPTSGGAASAFGPFDVQPRVFVSSFPDFDTFGRAYGALVQPHAVVTAALRALAAQITAGAPDRREEARRIYDWVSTHVRYLAVYLGQGALEPRDAQVVADSAWGDCKDHAVLFQALLAARGIASDVVMINLGNHYTLGTPPGFAQLNHAISYLPEFGLYADTTAGTAEFGTLPFDEYGKPVVHAGASLALRRVPPLAPGLARAELHTEAALDEDGTISGTTTLAATGPFAAELRRHATWADAVGSADVAESDLHQLGTEGTGRIAYGTPEKLSGPYEMTGHFTLDARPGLIAGDSFAPPLGPSALPRPGELLLTPPGYHPQPDEATPCRPGRQTEDVSLTLPAGRRVAHLPPDGKASEDGATYASHWWTEGATLHVRREFVSVVPGPTCTRPGVLAAIRRDLAQRVALAP